MFWDDFERVFHPLFMVDSCTYSQSSANDAPNFADVLENNDNDTHSKLDNHNPFPFYSSYVSCNRIEDVADV